MRASMLVIGAVASWLLVTPNAAICQLSVPQLNEENVKHGQEVFASTCTSYCHGINGEAGGAPRLAGRGFDAEYITKVVTYGITGTPMPAWGAKLSIGDLASVIFYVESLNGLTGSPKSDSTGELSLEARRGEDLFFDKAGDLKRCSNCHALNGKGIPVSPRIRSIPADASALRNLKTPHLVTATAGADTFPALVIAQTREETKLYDFTTLPLVLRTLSPASVKLSDGNSWRHSSAWDSFYSDEDLAAILQYLRAVVRP